MPWITCQWKKKGSPLWVNLCEFLVLMIACLNITVHLQCGGRRAQSPRYSFHLLLKGIPWHDRMTNSNDFLLLENKRRVVDLRLEIILPWRILTLPFRGWCRYTWICFWNWSWVISDLTDSLIWWANDFTFTALLKMLYRNCIFLKMLYKNVVR